MSIPMGESQHTARCLGLVCSPPECAVPPLRTMAGTAIGRFLGQQLDAGIASNQTL